MGFIDNDIRTKHFNKEKVELVSSKQTENGYYLIYQKKSGDRLGFDVTVSRKNGNLEINHKIYNENVKKNQQSK